MAFSVALAGYVSCLIASHIRWGGGLVSTPAILPGLSFGLTLAAWLLHREWIGRAKAIGLATGSAVAYFAAYWSAFYTIALCGKGMLFSTLKLALFHAGMMAGLVGTALLIASLAAVSADFRRKQWKALLLIGTAAGGALCLAGIGATSGNPAGTLANAGDRLFIFLWQLFVSGYVGMLLLATQSVSKPAERGLIAHWATRAVLALLLVSFAQAAIGFSRRDKESSIASSPTSDNSKARISTPQQVADSKTVDRETPEPDSRGQPLAFGGQWFFGDAFPMLTVTKLQNVSGKPIKAFRAILYRLDDFGDVQSNQAFEFTSSSGYGGAGKWTYDHVIQPKEIIYWHSSVGSEGLRSYFSGSNEIFGRVGLDQETLNAKAEKSQYFRLEVQRIVFNN